MRIEITGVEYNKKGAEIVILANELEKAFEAGWDEQFDIPEVKFIFDLKNPGNINYLNKFIASQKRAQSLVNASKIERLQACIGTVTYIGPAFLVRD